MEAFRRRRILDQRFALTTLQDPALEARYRAQQTEDTRRQAEALVLAKIVPQAAAQAAVKVFAEVAAPSNVVEVAAYDLVEAAAETLEPAPETAELVPMEAAAPARENSIRPERKPRARRRRATSLLPKRPCTSLERHRRKCTICAHPYRERIDDDFVNWRSTVDIAENYRLDGRGCIYRHAHATGLMARRCRNLRFATELLIEDAYNATPSADAILRAIRMSTCISDRGKWNEPPTEVVFSYQGPAPIHHRAANSPAAPPTRQLPPAPVSPRRAAKRLPSASILASGHDQPEIAVSNRKSQKLESDAKPLKTNIPYAHSNRKYFRGYDARRSSHIAPVPACGPWLQP
ncbi:MAG TPA: hypothetical protein VIH97_12455 [Candidatus Acidoferrales bacterium]